MGIWYQVDQARALYPILMLAHLFLPYYTGPAMPFVPWLKDSANRLIIITNIAKPSRRKGEAGFLKFLVTITTVLQSLTKRNQD